MQCHCRKTFNIFAFAINRYQCKVQSAFIARLIYFPLKVVQSLQWNSHSILMCDDWSHDHCSPACRSYVSESTTVREPVEGQTTQQAHGVSPLCCQATPETSTPRRAKSPTMKLVQQTEKCITVTHKHYWQVHKKCYTLSRRTANHALQMHLKRRKDNPRGC